VRYHPYTVIIGIILIGATLPAFAERIYTVGTAINAVASLDSNPRGNSLGLSPSVNGGYFTLYGLYPSISFNSGGLRSNVQLSYAFGFNRSPSEQGLRSESHSFSGRFNTSVSQNLRLSFSNSFTRSSDFTTFNVFRGIILTPEGLFFDFDTIALLQNSYRNNASLTFHYTLNSNSRLSFGAGHSIKRFDSEFSSRLSNQKGLRGNVAYSQKLNERTGWNVSYSASHNDFAEFENTLSHNTSIGLSRQISPTVSVGISGGASYVQSVGTQADSLGYNASFRISKAFEKNRISLSYNHLSATSTGVGSVSNADTIAFNFSQTLGRKVNIQTNLSVYETTAVLDNPVATRGGLASVLLSFLMNDNWALSLGATYRRQDETNISDLEQKRVYVSVSFNLPEFLRFEQ